MSRKLTRVLITLISLAVIFCIAVTALGFLTIRRSFPITNGEIVAPGLDGTVDIYRDTFGIPHVYADTYHDLFFTQGYLHAQDRFWQMDFWRHVGSGRLSELLGTDLLDTDVFLRSLGWARVVEQELQSIDPMSLEILNAYSKGVNAYLADHTDSELSLEYAILKLQNPDYQVEPWQPSHSLTWAKAMAWDLRGNMEDELMRAWLLNELTPEQVQQLYPTYPEDHPLIVPNLGSARLDPLNQTTALSLSRNLSTNEVQSFYMQALKTLGGRASKLDALIGKTGPGVGSNSWAISGELTSTGMPLLANDPHLGLQMPSIWYEIGLHCNQKSDDCLLDIDGFSFAGTPGVVIGHNDRIAWGFTNVGPDVIDLFIEKINPDNPNQYEVNGEWVDMDIIQETIQVAGGEPVDITIRYTRHGPILWDTEEGRQEFRDAVGIELPPNFALAIQWTALEVAHTFPALWKLNLAQNWEEFREAASEFDVPSQNFLYADVEGNIGYQMPGKIPIRTNGDGSLPVPGWTDEFEWTGYIPFDELPMAFNPPEGYIVTANNAVVGEEYPYLITVDWSYGFRARQIVDMIEASDRPIDIAYIQEMQGDNKNLNAMTLVPILMSLDLQNAELIEARAVLENWDYQDTMESPQGALFNVFWRHLLAETFHDQLSEELRPVGGGRYFEVMRYLVQDSSSAWWDNQQTPEIELMDDIFTKSFSQAVAEIKDVQGNNSERWNWGELHTTTFRNATLGESGIAPIESLFNRGPYPTAGGSSIVNATSWSALEPYIVEWIPSMRMIVDLGDLNNSITMHSTGQSGHAYHPNYIDMADHWRNIEYHPMLWSRQNVEASATDHLRLIP